MPGIRSETALQTPAIGKAGEYSVAAQLLLRNVEVYFPAADRGIDLLTDMGCRIQVKTSRIRCSSSVLKYYPEGIYSFHFPQKKYMATAAGAVRQRVNKKFSDYCDVVVLWGVEQNRFWVVPSHLLDGKHAIFMGPKNARAFASDLPEMKAMVNMGFSQKEIGKHFGITQSAIGHRFEKSENRSPTASRLVRDCENAWELITDFNRSTAIVHTQPDSVLVQE